MTNNSVVEPFDVAFVSSQKKGQHFQHSPIIGSLRGWAVLGVMMVHTGTCFPNLSSALGKITAQGARGVQLFFILSAITLLMSWHSRHEPQAAKRFLVRRFFRIAPMFYLAIACYALVDGFDARYFAPHGLGFFEYITTSLFLNAWFPTAINSVVPGGWSVGVEFFFYLLFPTLVITITNFRKSAIAFAGTLAIGLLISYALSIFIPAPDLESVRLRRDFIFLWPGIQLPIFFVGFLLYFYILEYYEGIRSTPALLGTTRHNIGRGMVILSIIGIVALSLFHIPIINHILFSIIFAFLFMGLTLAPTKILINRIMDHLGTVSYSAYFLHFAVIRISKPIIIPHLPTNDEGFFIYFICVFAATMLVSTMTYHCIEKPGIEMGRRFASKIK